MAKYLNEDGLSKVFTLIKTNFATKSEIPTNLNQLTNGPGYITGVSWDDIANKPTNFAVAEHTHTTADVDALTGYTLGTAGAIAASDSLNEALGKLQASINGKQAAGSYLTTTGTAADSSKLGGIAASSYAQLASPAFTGTPTAPAISNLETNTTQIATTAFVQSVAQAKADAAVADLVNSAPEALDTLNELASALGNDPNFATTIATQMGGKVSVGSADYLKGASVDSNTLTITKGDNSTVTFTNSVYTHPTSGVTAGSYGPTAAVTGSNNATINVPQITVDANGHVTAVTNRVYTSKDTTYSAGTAALLTTGTDTTNRVWTAKILADYVTGKVDAVDTGVMSVTTGSTNGTIAVDGTDVAVKGLGSAAYTASTAYAAASHNQASSTINAMTGYAKASATAAIATTDSLNTAIGKLEKALDEKQATMTELTDTEIETIWNSASDVGTPS